jgi:hypothetical protein
LSTPALRTSDLAAQRPHPPAAGDPYPAVVRIVRYLDLVLLALALPVFLVAGLPLLGWIAAAVGWVCQRAVRYALEERAAASDDPRTVAGIAVGSMIARGWLTALAIFAAGITEREAGLSAAILVIVLFTAFFSTQMALRPFDRSPVR